jgi:hypothetical protein
MLGLLFHLEDGGNIFLRNVRKYPTFYMALNPRGQ